MASNTPGMEIQQEVRLAVVMYGGVSLAIYINGVAQELLRMVRSTAPDPKNRDMPLLSDEELTGTEPVYRELGRMLGREGEEGPGNPIRTRFMVDILSGTSAGGINAIFLAKALANDQKMDQLKQLWIDEGDMEKLINDAESVKGIDGLNAQRPPKSLLNSQRMYRKLLDAFDSMEDEGKKTGLPSSPYVEDLDLFVTTTDIRGVPISLRLSDDVVSEKRHRNVFRFRYFCKGTEEDCSDFGKENNPFLAFAARCTSAFPFAFEPMKLSDIDAVIKKMPGYRPLQTTKGDPARWKRFFSSYRTSGYDPLLHPDMYDFRERSFGDGGYLDNKPFSYATDALASRRASVPVDRKLIYIEPSPEHPEYQTEKGDRPNAIENVAAALSLARYETIREDLKRILMRNRLIERVDRIISGMEDDVRIKMDSRPVNRPDFGNLDLREMIRKEGIAYGGYHRIKISALTDEITGMITRIAGFDVHSDEFLAIRYLVKAWRDTNYTAYFDEDGHEKGKDEPKPKRASQNQFLMQFDLAYRIRRLDFVMKKIDQLYCLDDRTRKILRHSGITVELKTAQDRKQFRTELARLRRELREVFLDLRKTREDLPSSGPEDQLAKEIKSAGISWEELRDILDQPTEKERIEYARSLLSEPLRSETFQRFASILAERIKECTIKTSARCHKILMPWRSGSFATIAAYVVLQYYDLYEHYDLISYPILHATEVGEEIDAVEVARISPEDANSIIDERISGRRKLAGTALMHFGAFLDRGWRRNDILWGRLDGAERIITILLPGTMREAERKRLIREAHLAILAEEFDTHDQDSLCQLLADALAKTDPSDPNEAALRELTEKELGSPVNPVLQSVLRKALGTEVLLDFFKRSYRVNRRMNPKTLIQVLARSTQVVGKILDDIAGRYKIDRKYTKWLVRLGRAFCGLVEVALPQSISNAIFRHWLKLLYLFEVLLILGGMIFLKPEIQRFGFYSLAGTLTVHLLVLLLGDYMRGGSK
ncbi:MAG: patatin-like protein [bacterium]